MYSPARSFPAEPDEDGRHQQEDADNEEAIVLVKRPVGLTI
jgi:hypothetical protein